MQKKRRREGKTDYKARMNLLKSGLPRIAVRISNRYCKIQYIKSKEAQDFVEIAADSKELLNYGWDKTMKGSLKNLAACYLTGYLLGIKIKDKEKGKEAIFDIGLKKHSEGSRVYAALKGLLDTSLEINHKPEILPDERSIRKKVDIDKIKENIDKKFV